MSKEKVSIASVLVNIVLASFKLFVGFISMSSAIIAEGIHSGMDIVSSGISYVGIRASKKPVDKEHPYGHY
ncbi:MAG: cation transporter, partial [Candidatus Aenigmarchaeota archaeon]|nr:cation transporter [Candidatus Aenigmarchaeota archaeon]